MTTIWGEIKKAQENNPTAVNDFAGKYHKPILLFLKSKGFSEQDAEDLAQEVFLVIFKDSVLNKADGSKGRLRTFLLAITENVIKRYYEKKSRVKRSENEKIISLDDEPNLEEIINYKGTDEEFDKIWLRNIITLSFERLRNECNAKDQPYFDALKLFLSENVTYEQLAQRLGTDLNNAKIYIHRAKEKLFSYVGDELASYCSSEEEYEDELKDFLRYFELLK